MSFTPDQLKLLTPEEAATKAQDWQTQFDVNVREMPPDYEETVNEIVERYRQLPPLKTLSIEYPQDIKKVAKMIASVEDLTKTMMHAGYPVKDHTSYRGEPDSQEFEVSHEMVPSRGKHFQLTLHKVVVEGNRFYLEKLREESNTGDSTEVSISLQLGGLISKCRSKNEEHLHFFIEGKYSSSPEDQKVRPSTNFCRCLEVWSEECGVNYGDTQEISTWDINVLNTNLDCYGVLFHSAPRAQGGLKFTVSSTCDETPAFPYDFEKSPTVHYKTRQRVYENRNIQKEVEANFSYKVEDIAMFLNAKNIIYLPIPRVLSMGLYCVVCKKTFANMIELFIHLTGSYPGLKFKMKGQDVYEGAMHLYVDISVSRYSGSTQQLNETFQDTTFNLHTILLNAFSPFEAVNPECRLNHLSAKYFQDLKDCKIICSECGLKPADWPLYASGITLVDNIHNSPDLLFNEKFFWTHFQSFVVKSQMMPVFRNWDFTKPHEDHCSHVYLFLRVFLHTHSVVLKNDHMKFALTFLQLVNNHLRSIFRLEEPFSVVFSNDLKRRALQCDAPQNEYYAEDSRMNALYAGNLKYFEQNGVSIEQLQRNPMPETLEERVCLLEAISKDEKANKVFPHSLIFTDKLDQFHIPRCLYFGIDCTIDEGWC